MINTILRAAALLMFSTVPVAYAQYGFNDGGFDTQAASVSNFCYFPSCPSGSWTGAAGFVRSRSPSWGNPAAVSGDSLAFPQANGYLSQTFTSTSSGTFVLTWFESDRPGYFGGQTYNVLVNGVVLATYTSSEPVFRRRVSTAFAMAAGSSYTVTFQGLSTEDKSALIDSVGIVVPEETISYTYDALGRLVTTSTSGGVNNGLNSSYTFDPAGNRTNVTVSGSRP